MKKISQAALVILAAAAVLGSCSQKPPTAPAETAKVYDSLTWVPTSVLYSDVPGKKDHSLVFVLASWCGWCHKLERETLTDTTVIRMLGESFNIARLDPDSDHMVVYKDTTMSERALARTVYGVSGYPTIIALDRQGNEIGPSPGYKNPSQFIALLELILREH